MLKALKYFLVLLVTLVIALAIYIQSQKVSDIPMTELTQRWAPAPSQFADIDGMQVHYRDEGPADDPNPIVLIHGTGASLHTWDGWTEVLKQHHRVIRFDIPAFGLTGPEPDNDYTIERYARFVVSMLDKLNAQQVILAGNSLGGYIAWATAVIHPDRVSRLVLVDSSGIPFESQSTPIAFTLSKNPLAKTLLKNFLPRFLVTRSLENVYGNPELVTEALTDRYYELTRREGNRAALQARFEQTKPGPMAHQVAGIKLPTLIMWGAKDKLIPLEVGKQFEQQITGSQLVVFDELGHVPHEEDPQKTVEAVVTFLAEP